MRVQAAVKYALELLVVVMINVCVVAFAGAVMRTNGTDPRLKYSGGPASILSGVEFAAAQTSPLLPAADDQRPTQPH